MLGKVYLLAYNCCLAFGWSIVLVNTIIQLYGTKSTTTVYKTIQVPLKVSQTLALLEVVHAAVGLVRSSPITTFIQVQSRLVVLWLALDSVKEIQSDSYVPMMICAWCVAEIVRYWFYALSLVDKVPYLLLWARYTFFTFLYPIGVSGELLTLYSVLPHATATGMYSLELPNKLNVSFNFPAFLMIYMLAYIPVLPQLYLHMVRQRKKVLAPKPDVGKKSE